MNTSWSPRSGDLYNISLGYAAVSKPDVTTPVYDHTEDVSGTEVCSHEEGLRIIDEFFPSYNTPHTAQNTSAQAVNDLDATSRNTRTPERSSAAGVVLYPEYGEAAATTTSSPLDSTKVDDCTEADHNCFQDPVSCDDDNPSEYATLHTADRAADALKTQTMTTTTPHRHTTRPNERGRRSPMSNSTAPAEVTDLVSELLSIENDKFAPLVTPVPHKGDAADSDGGDLPAHESGGTNGVEYPPTPTHVNVISHLPDRGTDTGPAGRFDLGARALVITREQIYATPPSDAENGIFASPADIGIGLAEDDTRSTTRSLDNERQPFQSVDVSGGKAINVSDTLSVEVARNASLVEAIKQIESDSLGALGATVEELGDHIAGSALVVPDDQRLHSEVIEDGLSSRGEDQTQLVPMDSHDSMDKVDPAGLTENIFHQTGQELPQNPGPLRDMNMLGAESTSQNQSGSHARITTHEDSRPHEDVISFDDLVAQFTNEALHSKDNVSLDTAPNVPSSDEAPWTNPTLSTKPGLSGDPDITKLTTETQYFQMREIVESGYGGASVLPTGDTLFSTLLRPAGGPILESKQESAPVSPSTVDLLAMFSLRTSGFDDALQRSLNRTDLATSTGQELAAKRSKVDTGDRQVPAETLSAKDATDQVVGKIDQETQDSAAEREVQDQSEDETDAEVDSAAEHTAAKHDLTEIGLELHDGCITVLGLRMPQEDATARLQDEKNQSCGTEKPDDHQPVEPLQVLAKPFHGPYSQAADAGLQERVATISVSPAIKASIPLADYTAEHLEQHVDAINSDLQSHATATTVSASSLLAPGPFVQTSDVEMQERATSASESPAMATVASLPDAQNDGIDTQAQESNVDIRKRGTDASVSISLPGTLVKHAELHTQTAEVDIERVEYWASISAISISSPYTPWEAAEPPAQDNVTELKESATAASVSPPRGATTIPPDTSAEHTGTGVSGLKGDSKERPLVTALSMSPTLPAPAPSTVISAPQPGLDVQNIEVDMQEPNSSTSSSSTAPPEAPAENAEAHVQTSHMEKQELTTENSVSVLQTLRASIPVSSSAEMGTEQDVQTTEVEMQECIPSMPDEHFEQHSRVADVETQKYTPESPILAASTPPPDSSAAQTEPQVEAAHAEVLDGTMNGLASPVLNTTEPPTSMPPLPLSESSTERAELLSKTAIVDMPDYTTEDPVSPNPREPVSPPQSSSQFAEPRIVDVAMQGHATAVSAAPTFSPALPAGTPAERIEKPSEATTVDMQDSTASVSVSPALTVSAPFNSPASNPSAEAPADRTEPHVQATQMDTQDQVATKSMPSSLSPIPLPAGSSTEPRRPRLRLRLPAPPEGYVNIKLAEVKSLYAEPMEVEPAEAEPADDVPEAYAVESSVPEPELSDVKSAEVEPADVDTHPPQARISEIDPGRGELAKLGHAQTEHTTADTAKINAAAMASTTAEAMDVDAIGKKPTYVVVLKIEALRAPTTECESHAPSPTAIEHAEPCSTKDNPTQTEPAKVDAAKFEPPDVETAISPSTPGSPCSDLSSIISSDLARLSPFADPAGPATPAPSDGASSTAHVKHEAEFHYGRRTTRSETKSPDGTAGAAGERDGELDEVREVGVKEEGGGGGEEMREGEETVTGGGGGGGGGASASKPKARQTRNPRGRRVSTTGTTTRKMAASASKVMKPGTLRGATKSMAAVSAAKAAGGARGAGNLQVAASTTPRTRAATGTAPAAAPPTAGSVPTRRSSRRSSAAITATPTPTPAPASIATRPIAPSLPTSTRTTRSSSHRTHLPPPLPAATTPSLHPAPVHSHATRSSCKNTPVQFPRPSVSAVGASGYLQGGSFVGEEGGGLGDGLAGVVEEEENEKGEEDADAAAAAAAAEMLIRLSGSGIVSVSSSGRGTRSVAHPDPALPGAGLPLPAPAPTTAPPQTPASAPAPPQTSDLETAAPESKSVVLGKRKLRRPSAADEEVAEAAARAAGRASAWGAGGEGGDATSATSRAKGKGKAQEKGKEEAKAKDMGVDVDVGGEEKEDGGGGRKLRRRE